VIHRASGIGQSVFGRADLAVPLDSSAFQAAMCGSRKGAAHIQLAHSGATWETKQAAQSESGARSVKIILLIVMKNRHAVARRA
jgi:hypothetical protein